VKALILVPFQPEALQRLRACVEVTCESWMETRKLYSPEELAERIQNEGFQIVVIEADFVFDEVFENARDLRFVGVCRGAVDHVDVNAATEHGVLVVNTPARNATGVAELTIGLMLSLARRIPEAHALVRSGGWIDPVGPYMSLRGLELSTKTVGIVGLGAIGCEVSKRLCAFDMTVLAYDPYVPAERFALAGAVKVDLNTLVSEADFITIHCPLTPATAGLIGSEQIARMKPTAFLVNTAGWEIVEENALMAALSERRIAGAAFDVYETHPVSADSPLLKLDNVVLTPHIGGATDGTIARYSMSITEDIERFVAGKRPLNLVNPAAWSGHGL